MLKISTLSMSQNGLSCLNSVLSSLCRATAQSIGSLWTSVFGTSLVNCPPNASLRQLSLPSSYLASPRWASLTRSPCSKPPASTSLWVLSSLSAAKSRESWERLSFWSPTLSADFKNLHSLHSRPGHHDLLWWFDSEPHSNAQCWVRTPYRPGVLLCQPVASAGNGRCRDWIA